jgi:hypothetical protein
MYIPGGDVAVLTTDATAYRRARIFGGQLVPVSIVYKSCRDAKQARGEHDRALISFARCQGLFSPTVINKQVGRLVCVNMPQYEILCLCSIRATRYSIIICGTIHST